MNVPKGLKPHDEQTLDIAKKLETPAAPFLKQELPVQNADLVNPTAARNIVKEIRFVISVQALANRGVLGLPDIEQPGTRNDASEPPFQA